MSFPHGTVLAPPPEFGGPEHPPRVDILFGLLIGVALAALFFMATPPTTANGGFENDALFYASRAGLDHPYAAEMRRFAPYCWRVLTPFLVSLLPFPPLEGFRLVAFLATAATLAILFQAVRDIGLPRPQATIGILLYAGVFWTVRFSFHAPAYIDPMTQLVIVAIWMLAGRGLRWVLLPVFLVGALQRETVLLMVPVAYVMLVTRSGQRSRGNLAFLGGALAAAAAPLVLLHMFIRPVNPGYVKEGLGWLPYLAKAEFWPRFLGETLSGLGLLPMILALFPRRTMDLVRRMPAVAAAVALGLPVLAGGWDKGRLYLFMVPPLALAAAATLQREGNLLPVGSRVGWWACTVALHAFIGGAIGALGSHQELQARVAALNAQGAGYRMVVARSVLLAALWLALSLFLFRHAGRQCGESSPAPKDRE